jgi:hypothetical protein
MKNMPYNVMRHRDWDKAPRDPVTIGDGYCIPGLGGSWRLLLRRQALSWSPLLFTSAMWQHRS